MKLVLDIVMLLIGFVLLLKGADFLIEGAVGFARKFHIPALVIGMTIVAFGTSAPEAAVSITAALDGNNAIAVSNVIGSNIFNLMVVGGLCAMMRPLPIKPIAVSRDYPFHLVITAVLLVMLLDIPLGGGQAITLSRGDALILLLFMGIYMYINIRDGIGGENEESNAVIPPVWKSLLFFVGGLAGVIWGGNLVVDSATGLARAMGVSDTLIGLTIVAIGTSLPELVTSVVACKRGESDLAWGNIIGSSIFNILFILGISTLLHPITVGTESLYDTVILLVLATLVYPTTIPKKQLSRPVGFAMLVAYIAYTAYIIIR